MLALMEAAAQHFTRDAVDGARDARPASTCWGAASRRRPWSASARARRATRWDDLLDAMKQRFSPGALLTAGLVLERQDKSGHYDRFRDRAVFPILSEGGKVVAFGARSLDGSEPKYLNSPETPVY